MDRPRLSPQRGVNASRFKPGYDQQPRAPIVTTAPTILLFDSGLGGLTVFRETVSARPDARFVFVADDAFFPYGGHGEAKLVARVVPLMGELIETHQPALVIIACNTASTLVLPHLRARFTVPFIGTVPAIKPACAASLTRRVSVLGTEATVNREYTRALIRDFANGSDVTLVGSARLAGFAEAELQGTPEADEAIATEIAPCFVETGGQRTDTIVLACTHFPLLVPRFQTLAPWLVNFIDPAPAIARRLLELMGPPAASAPPGGTRIIFTSGKVASPALAASLKRFGMNV
jgi:glutamate racemase